MAFMQNTNHNNCHNNNNDNLHFKIFLKMIVALITCCGAEPHVSSLPPFLSLNSDEAVSSHFRAFGRCNCRATQTHQRTRIHAHSSEDLCRQWCRLRIQSMSNNKSPLGFRYKTTHTPVGYSHNHNNVQITYTTFFTA